MKSFHYYLVNHESSELWFNESFNTLCFSLHRRTTLYQSVEVFRWKIASKGKGETDELFIKNLKKVSKN